MKPLPPVPELGAWLDGDAARFRVWAPDHARVELILYRADRSILATRPMRRERGGFFVSTAPLPAGPRPLLYAFRIDERGPFPDPCSGSQPFGVHGPSELIDFDRDFAWTDAGFAGRTLVDLVLYEIHVGAATPEGTFEALIPRLESLVDLGVTAIELMPIASFPGRWNWGYDGVSLRAPAAVYGGPRGLMRLVDAAHARGLAVILDVVYNHLGPDGNYLRAFSSRYFTSRRTTPWGEAIDVDGPGAEPVRELLLGSAAMWIDRYHLDGLRLDATHAIADTRPVHLVRELAERARAAGGARRTLLIAEDERNEAALVRPVELGGLGLDAVWADDLHYELGAAFADDLGVFAADFTGGAREIASTIGRGWRYEGQVSPRLGRARGTSAAAIDAPRIVTFVQNHDQIGNRPRGDRLGARVSPAAFRAMSALLLLAPYTPLIFMGQEWNATTPFFYFTDHHGELGRLVTEGRRRELRASGLPGAMETPDPQAEATFLRSRLDWAERDRPEHAAVLALYRELLRLRATHPALRERARGSFAARAAPRAPRWWALPHRPRQRARTSRARRGVPSSRPALDRRSALRRARRGVASPRHRAPRRADGARPRRAAARIRGRIRGRIRRQKRRSRPGVPERPRRVARGDVLVSVSWLQSGRGDLASVGLRVPAGAEGGQLGRIRDVEDAAEPTFAVGQILGHDLLALHREVRVDARAGDSLQRPERIGARAAERRLRDDLGLRLPHRVLPVGDDVVAGNRGPEASDVVLDAAGVVGVLEVPSELGPLSGGRDVDLHVRPLVLDRLGRHRGAARIRRIRHRIRGMSRDGREVLHGRGRGRHHAESVSVGLHRRELAERVRRMLREDVSAVGVLDVRSVRIRRADAVLVLDQDPHRVRLERDERGDREVRLRPVVAAALGVIGLEAHLIPRNGASRARGTDGIVLGREGQAGAGVPDLAHDRGLRAREDRRRRRERREADQPSQSLDFHDARS